MYFGVSLFLLYLLEGKQIFMNYGCLLAGGIGKRMNSKVPKQFIELKGTPVIIYTLKQLLKCSRLDKVIIAIHKEWKSYLEDLIFKFIPKEKQNAIEIVFGGEERIDSIDNVIEYISSKYGINNDDNIVFHDAVRPFVTQSILEMSISALQQHSAVVAAIPVVDTMLFSPDGFKIESMPDRKAIFHGQAPDSFKLNVFKKALKTLTKEEKMEVTGTAQICFVKGIDVFMVPGDSSNFKITTRQDLDYANYYLDKINFE